MHGSTDRLGKVHNDQNESNWKCSGRVEVIQSEIEFCSHCYDNPIFFSDIKEPIFLVSATLRPETMYGQTNCWLHPDIKYIAFKSTKTNEVWVCTNRAARNLSYQGFTAVEGKVEVLTEILGSDLLGIALSVPLTHHKIVYALPSLKEIHKACYAICHANQGTS